MQVEEHINRYVPLKFVTETVYTPAQEIRLCRIKQKLDRKGEVSDNQSENCERCRYSLLYHTLKAGEVVLFIPHYIYIIVISGVSDRNGKLMVGTDNGNWESVLPDDLLWIEHYGSETSVFGHRLLKCSFLLGNSERFCGPSSCRFSYQLLYAMGGTNISSKLPHYIAKSEPADNTKLYQVGIHKP